MKKTKQLIAVLTAVAFLLVFSNRIIAQSYPEMVKVQGGTFTMGDEWGVGAKSERPVHLVTLKSFNIAKTLTTVAQWSAYCTATGRKMPKAPAWGWHDDDPIVNVNWDDAVAYCAWLSYTTGNLYRLPAEAEFEYAARGGNMSKGFKYSGSNNPDEVGWHEADSGGHPHAVASKKPNELGLYDMSGNVWEWCRDWYGPYSSSPSSNPKGPSSGSYRVMRGGGWGHAANCCRVSYRNYEDSDDIGNACGFRVVSFE